MNRASQNENLVAVPAGRLVRLGHISTVTAKVASTMAFDGITQLTTGQIPVIKDLLLTPQNISRLTEQLAKMRGAAMKIGQLVSMDSSGFLSPELTQIMARLRDNAYAMPPSQLKQVLNAQLQMGWLTSFKKFDVRPIAAASIGQVHRAQLKDGRDLAIKIQYPGVATSINSDIANIGVLIKMSGLLPKGFNLAAYLEEGRKQLHEETNYVQEATNLSKFKGLLKDAPQFVVPAVHSDWSSPTILAMDYVDGVAIESLSSATQEVRDNVIINLIELALKELLDFRLMQTDPNFANYLYNHNTQQIVLLDFGAVTKINSGIVNKYKRLLSAGLNNDTDALMDAASSIGFVDSSTSMEHHVNISQMISSVFSVILKDGSINFSNLDLPQRLQIEGLALLEDGFLPPILPINILLIQRKFAGIFLLAMKLSANVNIRKILQAQRQFRP